MTNNTRSTAEPRVAHRCLSTIALVERICDQGDRAALREFLNRHIFRGTRGRSLALTDYLAELQESPRAWEWCGRMIEALDGAYDLTLDKFSHLPDPLKRRMPDCRYYFQAFLDHVTKILAKRDLVCQVEQERIAATSLQTQVYRHFHLSCLETARRAKSPTRRYAWKVNGHTIPLRVPAIIRGLAWREWLAANVADVDPQRPGERERIQALVDERLGRPRIVAFNATVGSHARDGGEDVLSWATAQQVSVKGLAAAVAAEKAANIDCQRPTIRRLTAAKLEELVVSVFRSLSDENRRYGAIATEFGLSKPTFSRFAGRRWPDNASGCIPDLFVNTARTLAAHSEFVEAAKDAGVWERVLRVLEQLTPEANGHAD